MPTHSLQFPIRVPDDVLLELGEFTGKFWSDTFGLEPFVCEAIRNYINPPPPPPQQPAALSETGYQWKEVFLPEGTRLRASFDRQQYFATVEGTEIKYGKHAVSPSCFANLQGSGNRNAWKAVWLRLPGSDAWLLADVCRAARKAAITRMLAGEAQEDSQRAHKAIEPAQDHPTQPSQRRTASPAARQTTPRLSSGRPPGAPAATPGNGTQSSSGSGRSARRRKRRAAKTTS
ncbi:hypothetical protein [Duganella sp. HH101]|uniref:hypothetical protein n=1 Tax=Duganella sp. HH101 TaxID=1781066 RepID=UPI00089335EE|nr:hypothetical protein [Duganella sp. HH101]OFA03589.1 hypothetical protein DUGA2_26270 [Duganella sp. HH101]